MAVPSGGWSFDRAASYYDATRALPSDVVQALASLLHAEVAGRGRALEVGVGTGRIALPLADRGVALVGVDTAEGMLRRLVRAAAGRSPFPVARADAARLPFRDSAFGVVLFSHVLHLIPAWQAVVDEAVRVLAAAGGLLVDFGGAPPAPWARDTEAIFRAHDILRVRPGVSTPEPVAEHLRGRATSRPLPPVRLRVPRTLGQDLHDWEQQIHSWTWPYRAEQMHAACAAIRSWAAGSGVSLDEQVQLDRVIQWWAFDLADRS